MIKLLLYAERTKDKSYLAELAKNIVAKFMDEELIIFDFKTQEEECLHLMEENEIQASIVDITGKGGISVAEKLRNASQFMEIMIVADTSISPICYLNPRVRATSLLLKPFENEMAEDIVFGFIRQFVKEEDSPEQYFSVSRRSEVFRVPYRDIFYFEARDKKMCVRYGMHEYTIYISMATLLEMLPSKFVRCHRSFVVNLLQILSVNYTDNLISLGNNEMIPMSRGCRTAVREALKNEERK